MAQASVETKRAFGFLFICVSISVGAGAVLSHLVYISNFPIYYYAVVWLGSFGAVFGVAMPKFRRVGPAIRSRMKRSMTWSSATKAINGLSWAAPFAAIPLFPFLYEYLILLGIGLGNLSTYYLIRKHGGGDNREQLIVASIALAAIPAALLIDRSIFPNSQELAVVFSRLLIATSYGAGGLFAMLSSE